MRVPQPSSSRWGSCRADRAPWRQAWARPGGGLLIALGLATPAAGAAAAGTMIPAATVLAPGGFFATGGGYEYPALLGVSAAALAITGPGDWSLDACLGYRLNRPWMAATTLLASAAASLAVLQRRRQLLATRAANATQAGDDPATRAGQPSPDANMPSSQG